MSDMASIEECQSEERVMHICDDPDLCEQTDTRPPVDLMAKGRPRLRLVDAASNNAETP